MSLAHQIHTPHLSPQTHESDMLAIPKLMPQFTRGLGALASRVGFATAVDSMLEAANVHVELEGDLSEASGAGLIVASDHRNRLEPLLVQAAMNKAKRPASYVMAMPTSFPGRVIQASGEQGRGLVIPVVPSYVAIDGNHPNLDARTLRQHRRHPHIFDRTKAELKSRNSEAIARAAGLVAAGNTVTICPADVAVEAGNSVWRPGVGRVIQELPEESLATAKVAVMRSEGFSAKKVVAALGMRMVGLRPKPQTVTIRTAVLGSAAELFGSLAASNDPAAAQRITGIIRSGYKQVFGV